MNLNEQLTRIKEMMGFDESDNNVIQPDATNKKVTINLDTPYTNIELVPISELVKFREFNRRKQPKWDKNDSDETIEHLKNAFLTEGITKPLIIDYAQHQKRVLLVEGCHRLNAAIELNLNYMPCRVVRTTRDFPKHMLKKTMEVSGYPPNQHNYVPGDLTPSQVGIPGTKPLTNNPY